MNGQVDDVTYSYMKHGGLFCNFWIKRICRLKSASNKKLILIIFPHKMDIRKKNNLVSNLKARILQTFRAQLHPVKEAHVMRRDYIQLLLTS